MTNPTALLSSDVPIHILLIEDQPDDCELIEHLLSRAFTRQIKLLACQNLHDARIALTEHAAFDLILLDLNLPDGFGLHILKQVRKMASGTPVVILTGYIVPELVTRALEYGALDVIDKTDLNAALLKHIVRQAILRHKTETILKTREAQQALLLDQVNSVVIATNEDGRITFWNKYAEFLCQWRSEEVLGRDIMEVTVPKDAAQVASEIMQSLSTQSRWEGEFAIRRKDGIIIPVWTTLTQSFDSTGKSTGLVGVSFDLSEKKRVEEALKQSELRFRQLAENIQEAFWMVDLNQQQVIYLSPAYETIYGYSRDAFYQQEISFLDIVHPEDHDQIVKVLPQQLLGQCSHEYRIIWPDGTVRWVWDRSFPVYSEEGEVYRIAGVATDITEDRLKHDKLTESLQRFELASLATNDLIYEWNIITDHTTLNLAAERLFGYPVREVQGQNWWPDKVHPDDWPGANERVAEILASGDQLHAKEYRFRRADGTYAYVFDRGYIVRDSQGNPLRMIGAMTDLTERKQYEDALAKSEARFRTLCESLPIGILILDGENIVYANAEVARVTGYDRETLAKLGVMTLIAPEYHATARERMERLQHERFSLPPQERKVITRDGREIWIESSIVTIELEGRPVALQIAQDITARKKIEDERNQLMRDLAERVKELSILHQISELLRDEKRDLAELLSDIASLLPKGWKQPGLTSARIQVGDLEAAPETFMNSNWMQRLNFSAVDGTPGTLEIAYLKHADTSPFLPEEAALLRSVAEMLRSYLERRHAKEAIETLNEDLSRRLILLDALRQIDTAITSNLELSVTLRRVAEEVQRSLNVDAVEVYLYTPEHRQLSSIARVGFALPDSQLRAFELGDQSELIPLAAREQRSHFIPDLEETDRASTYVDLCLKEGFVSQYILPLISKAELQGVLCLCHRTSLEIDDDWRHVAEALSLQTAIAIDNARLFQNLQHAKTTLERAYDATIEGWSRALDLKDEETAGHSRRVTDLTVRLARRFGMSEQQLLDIKRGALLHDIGKMGIPDDILLKPGKLSAQEWEIMKGHTTYAYKLLSPIPFLRQALEIPYSHHEKWNGSGYPRGLSGEEIPLAARIFAVVDVFDALTSDRPYRRAWTQEKALAFIQNESGRHLDPQVVNAFLEMITHDKASLVE
jgi:PAS domain S-box-containing protein